jgi:hypothetical protein
MREWPPLESSGLLGPPEGSGGGSGDDEPSDVDGGALLAVVLNYTLPACTPAVWRRSRLRVAADGGVNRLYDELPALLPHRSADEARRPRRARPACPPARTLRPPRLALSSATALTRRRAAQVRDAFVPDVVKGDLDSARPEVLAFYERRGALIINAAADQARARERSCAAAARVAHADLGPRAPPGHHRPAEVRRLRHGRRGHGPAAGPAAAQRGGAGRAGRAAGPPAVSAERAARVAARAHHAAGRRQRGCAAAAGQAPHSHGAAAGGARLRAGAAGCVRWGQWPVCAACTLALTPPPRTQLAPRWSPRAACSGTWTPRGWSWAGWCAGSCTACGACVAAAAATPASRRLCRPRRAQVSTSNRVIAAEVVVETDAPLVWTTQLHLRAPGQAAEADG